MASTYSDLKIQLMQTGENTGTWGNVTNANLTALEEAIAESVDVPFSSADVTLTLTNSNASQSARFLRLKCTGTTGGARSLILGSGCQIEKLYLVSNTCADAITVKNTTGNGIAVPAGKTMYVYNDGTDVVDAVTHLTSLTLASALPVTSGGTGSTTGTFSGANITSINANNISTGTLAVARGGTGATTLDSEAVVIGNATSSVKFVSPGSSGNVLTSNGTSWVSQVGTGGNGSVTSVGTGAGTINGISLTGGPITTSGTISLGGAINASTISTGVLAVGHGGTGGSTTQTARTGLGLGTISTQDSDNVTITGGSITGVSGVATLSGTQTFTGAKTFTGGITSTDFDFTATSSIYLTSGTVKVDISNNNVVVFDPSGGAYRMVFNNTNKGIKWDGTSLGVGWETSGTFIAFNSGFLESNTSDTRKPGGGSWTSSSDARLKENVVNYTQGLSAITALRPVRYNYNDVTKLGVDTNHKTFTGLIAQEVEQTSLADMVAVGADNYLNLDPSELTFTLVNAVKELSAQVDALKAEVAALKGA